MHDKYVWCYNVFTTFNYTHHYLQWINMIQTKTIAMLMIAIATVGVMASTMSSVVPVLAAQDTTTVTTIPPGQPLPGIGTCSAPLSCTSTTTQQNGHGGNYAATTNADPNIAIATITVSKCNGNPDFQADHGCTK